MDQQLLRECKLEREKDGGLDILNILTTEYKILSVQYRYGKVRTFQTALNQKD